jgi:hypothetical protein
MEPCVDFFGTADEELSAEAFSYPSESALGWLSASNEASAQSPRAQTKNLGLDHDRLAGASAIEACRARPRQGGKLLSRSPRQPIIIHHGAHSYA